jgi:hypothetical protein
VPLTHKQLTTPITINCKCGKTAELGPGMAQGQLLRHGWYGYGDHITDPLAFVRKLLTLAGWRYLGGRVTKMRCPSCMPKRPEKEK